jgi:hypothetical protein
MMQFPLQTPQLKSYYKVERISSKTGRVRWSSGWSNNVLLTSGRNAMGSQSGWFNYCQLGTDATDPVAGQTGLLGYVNGTNNVEEDTFGAEGSAPYYGWRRKRFRFLPGEVSGNLNEVGVGWAASGSTLVFRALLEDITGTQVTVTPLPDEYVDVICEIRCYPPLEDVTGTVDFNGVTYDYLIRAAEVTSGTFWGSFIGDQVGHKDTFTSWWQAYDNDISTIDQAPNGVVYYSDGTNAYDIAYSNNSYQRQMAQIGGPNAWNATTGKKLRSFRFVTTLGAYQIQFDSQASPGNGIPKTDAYNIKFQFVLGWAEAGPIFTGPVATQNWSNGVAITPLDISTYYQAGLPEPITYTVVAGTMPSGLSLNSSTGVISGTPDTVSSGTLQIQCENEVGKASTNEFSWTVA